MAKSFTWEDMWDGLTLDGKWNALKRSGFREGVHWRRENFGHQASYEIRQYALQTNRQRFILSIQIVWHERKLNALRNSAKWHDAELDRLRREAALCGFVDEPIPLGRKFRIDEISEPT